MKTASNNSTFSERLFCGCFGAGLSWADRSRERGGDYARLAFLGFGNLALQIEPDCPPDLRAHIEAQAAALQARRGEEYQVSTSGQTVTLGYALPAIASA
jgi:hypothetical protein